MTNNVKHLLQARNSAFRSGDRQLYSAARTNLRKGIRDAKAVYKQRIENHFCNSDPRRAWQGIRHITGQTNTICLSNSSASMAEQLNQFFSRFEVESTETTINPVPDTNSSQVLILQPIEVMRTLRKIKAWKASGPDGIPGRALRDCAIELGEVLTNIFNLSLL